MTVADLVVLVGSLVAIGGLAWFFFAPRRAHVAEFADGVQRVQITVRGGYHPDVIRVRQGHEVELVFDRRESGECTSRVVFGDFALSAALPAFERTTVRLLPRQAGTYGFACGMNMVHGTLLVDPATDEPPLPASPSAPSTSPAPPPDRGREEHGSRSAAETEAAEAAERRTEIADLTRRVGVGAVLTLPVLFAVMAHDLFRATWVPQWLLNPWLQLALITPVMLYTGWPIHRTG